MSRREILGRRSGFIADLFAGEGMMHRADRLGDEIAELVVAGVEVKLSGTVVAKDFRGLKKLREAVGARFTAGVVLYDGEVTIPFGEGLFAVPLRRLWTEKK